MTSVKLIVPNLVDSYTNLLELSRCDTVAMRTYGWCICRAMWIYSTSIPLGPFLILYFSLRLSSPGCLFENSVCSACCTNWSCVRSLEQNSVHIVWMSPPVTFLFVGPPTGCLSTRDTKLHTRPARTIVFRSPRCNGWRTAGRRRYW